MFRKDCFRLHLLYLFTLGMICFVLFCFVFLRLEKGNDNSNTPCISFPTLTSYPTPTLGGTPNFFLGDTSNFKNERKRYKIHVDYQKNQGQLLFRFYAAVKKNTGGCSNPPLVRRGLKQKMQVIFVKLYIRPLNVLLCSQELWHYPLPLWKRCKLERNVSMITSTIVPYNHHNVPGTLKRKLKSDSDVLLYCRFVFIPITQISNNSRWMKKEFPRSTELLYKCMLIWMKYTIFTSKLIYVTKCYMDKQVSIKTGSFSSIKHNIWVYPTW